MKRELHIGADLEEISHRAAQLFARTIAQQGSTSQRLAVVLSGGRTPRRTYELLASEPYRSRIAWEKVHFFWGDERTVPPDHPDSNYRLAFESLLSPLAIPDAQIHRIEGERADPRQAALAYQQEIARFFSLPENAPPPTFDWIFLGMGSDGHVASLFPGTAALREREHWVVANWVPQLDSWRITLTLPVLNAGRCVLVLVAGPEKAEAVREVWQSTRDARGLPAAQLAPKGRLLWLVDRLAAAKLPPATAAMKDSTEL